MVVGDGRGSLVCSDSLGFIQSDTTEQLIFSFSQENSQPSSFISQFCQVLEEEIIPILQNSCRKWKRQECLASHSIDQNNPDTKIQRKTELKIPIFLMQRFFNFFSKSNSTNKSSHIMKRELGDSWGWGELKEEFS